MKQLNKSFKTFTLSLPGSSTISAEDCMQHMLTSYSAQAEADWARYPAVPFPPQLWFTRWCVNMPCICPRQGVVWCQWEFQIGSAQECRARVRWMTTQGKKTAPCPSDRVQKQQGIRKKGSSHHLLARSLLSHKPSRKSTSCRRNKVDQCKTRASFSIHWLLFFSLLLFQITTSKD